VPRAVVVKVTVVVSQADTGIFVELVEKLEFDSPVPPIWVSSVDHLVAVVL